MPSAASTVAMANWALAALVRLTLAMEENELVVVLNTVAPVVLPSVIAPLLLLSETVPVFLPESPAASVRRLPLKLTVWAPAVAVSA